jgi:hypothetical protein
MIHITSYKNINDVSFGCTESEALSAFGSPTKQQVNREKEKELFFPDFILRFEPNSGQLRECTLLPGCEATVNNQFVVWTEEFLYWLASEDNELVEVLGYIVSIKLGLAITGFHDGDEAQKAVHAFRKGDWDMFKNRMLPFILKK